MGALFSALRRWCESVTFAHLPAATLDCNTLHQTIHLEFDHVAGLAGADAVSVTGHWSYAALIDDYTLMELDAGTVVPITVVGDFDLQNIRKDTAVTWSEGAVSTPPIPGAPDPSLVETFFTASATGTETATRQVRLTVNMKAGEPYEIQLGAAVFSSGGAGGFSHGRLSFEPLTLPHTAGRATFGDARADPSGAPSSFRRAP